MKPQALASFLFLLLAGHASCVGRSAANILENPRNSSIATPLSENEAFHLGLVKVGIAVALFVLVLVACGIPILVMNCVERRADARPVVLVTLSNDSSQSEPYVSSGDDSREEESGSHEDYDAANRGSANTFSENSEPQWSSNSAGPLIQQSRGVARTGIASRDVFRRKNIILLWASRITCFAAGVFLSTGFMDLFPEVEEAFTVAFSMLNVEFHYPLAAFFTLLGFFLVLLVEQLVIVCHNRNHGPYSHPHPVSESADDHNESGGHSHLSMDETSSMVRVLLLLIALSVHSIFEGLAVGLQKTVSEVVRLFLALLLHKLIIAGTIGVSLATTQRALKDGLNAATSGQHKKSLKSQIVGTIVFALASPIGVLIGWALVAQQLSTVLLVVIAVLQGLACGTFFFVVFCEMLPHEFKEGATDRLIKFIFLILGFALVSVCIIYNDE